MLTEQKEERELFKIFIGGVPTHAKKEELEGFLSSHIRKFELTLKPRHNNPDLNLGFAVLETELKATSNYLLGLRRANFKGKLLEFKPFLEGKKLESMLKSQEERRLMAVGIPEDLREKDLINFFSNFGKIDNFYFVRDFKSKDKTGNAVIIFSDTAGAEQLKEKAPFIINGCAIHVQKVETNMMKGKKKKKKTEENKAGIQKPKLNGKRRRMEEFEVDSKGKEVNSEHSTAQDAQDESYLLDKRSVVITYKGDYKNSDSLCSILEELKKGSWESAHKIHNIRLNKRKMKGVHKRGKKRRKKKRGRITASFKKKSYNNAVKYEHYEHTPQPQCNSGIYYEQGYGHYDGDRTRQHGF